jgi:hypothetical protein
MRRLISEAPINKLLPTDTKQKYDEKHIKRVNDARSRTGQSSMGTMMDLIKRTLPEKEFFYQDELLELAKSYFFYKFPEAKKNYDNGTLTLDFEFSQNPQIRDTRQYVKPEEIETARELDKNPETNKSLFDTRVKTRHLINSMTQGSAWSEGFEAFKVIEKNLNQIDPELTKLYQEFQDASTVYYNDAEASLEQMAKQSGNRVAFTDLVSDTTKKGAWKLIVRAPMFPLLMHEVQKGGYLYMSKLTRPKDKVVANTLKHAADTHEYEIKNMRYGKEIWGKVRYMWAEIVGDDFRDWMDSLMMGYFNQLSVEDPENFLFIFLGEFDDNGNPTGVGGILNDNPKTQEQKEAYDESYELFETYVNMFYNNIKEHYKKPEDMNKKLEFEYYKKEGDKQFKMKNYEKALESYQNALKFKKDSEIEIKIDDVEYELKKLSGEPESEDDDDMSWL